MKFWSANEDEHIRENWGTLSASDIGRSIGRSKNSVVGRAHRIGLPAIAIKPEMFRADEDNYIRDNWGFITSLQIASRLGRHESSIRKRGRRLGLPELIDFRPVPEGRPPADTLPRLQCLQGKAITMPPSKPKPKRHIPSIHPCCWPIGEPGTPSFRFCDAPAVFGRPYCPEHIKIAYVPSKRRPEIEEAG